ncbi:MAG: zinc-ribbon domain-containing protein [Acidobacteriia bacterium]|nr:zinc-ribbon domain-containing protein [Terriglobia bacterium]
MFCHHCGAQVDAGSQFCRSCGKPLAGPPGPSAAAPLPPWTPPARVHASAGHWLGAGWNLVMADLGTYVLLALLFFVLGTVPLIGGALIAGFHIYTMKKLTGRNPDIGDFFKGFNFFIATLVASILIGLFTFLGTLALIIPGLVIAAMYKFTYLFIVDKRMDFWQAMQASHAVVRQDYFGFTMFLILAFLVNVLGFCCLLVGLLVTVPMTFAAVTIAYKELVGFETRTLDSL